MTIPNATADTPLPPLNPLAVLFIRAAPACFRQRAVGRAALFLAVSAQLDYHLGPGGRRSLAVTCGR